MHFKRQVFATLLYRSSIFILAIWNSILTYRALATEQRGLLTYVVFILGLITSFADLGLGASAVYLYGSKSISLVELKKAVFTLTISLTFIFWGLAYYYFGHHVGYEAQTAYEWVPFLMFMVIPLAIFGKLWESVIYAENRITVLNRSSISIQIVSTVVLSFGYLTDRLTLSYVFLSILLSHLIQALYLLWTSRPVLSFSFSNDLRNLLKVGVRGYIGNLASYGNYRVSYYFITSMLGPSALAIYSLGILLSEKVSDISSVASTILFPQVAQATEREFFRERTERIARTTMLLTFILCVLIAVLAPWIIRHLYGKNYESAISILWILLPGTLFLSWGKILSAHLSGEGHIWSTCWPMIVLLPIYTLGLWIFLPIGNLKAAAILTSINYALMAVALTILYVKKTGRNFLSIFKESSVS